MMFLGVQLYMVIYSMKYQCNIRAGNCHIMGRVVMCCFIKSWKVVVSTAVTDNDFFIDVYLLHWLCYQI